MWNKNRKSSLHYEKLLEKFPHVKIGVIGDIVVDRFVYGVPERLSREAPVTIIRYEGEEIFPGCAGNTIRNLQDLEAFVYPVSILGDDEWGHKILESFKGSKVSTSEIFISSRGRTVTKTRIMAGDFHTKKQQVVRIDRGEGAYIGEKEKKKILDSILKLSEILDCWIVSDYAYGLVFPEVTKLMSQVAKKIPVLVDSRKNATSFKKVTLLTPNEEEAVKASGIIIKTKEDLLQVGKRLLELTEAQSILVTRGNQGMSLFEKGKNPIHIPCHGSLHIADVTGAGDTVTSLAALTLATKGSLEDAAHLATYGASIVVMKMGTATCSKEELIETISKEET